MRQRAVGIKQVAGEAGVSVATVSQVLNAVEGARVSDETRARVHATAERLGYVPNRMARGLRTQRSQALGLIGDQIATTPYSGRMVLGAQEAALRHGFTMVLFNTESDQAVEERDIRNLMQYQVDGILYATMYHRVVDVPAVLRGVPTVLLDCESSDATISAVVPDEVAGGRAAVEELLAHGHRRIGFATNLDPVPATAGRLEGYRQALSGAGVPFDQSLVVADESESGGGYRASRALLERVDSPSAIFCFNDRMAMGAYRAAAELGLKIPADLSIVGFDNQEVIAAGLFPDLTTVTLPHHAMGAWAVDTLVAQLAGAGPDPAAHPLLMNCPLVRRSSVAPPSRSGAPQRP
ncbi:LacI family DNA-binding transcriptional regulator [Pengzhenrongella sp.]|jgi:LacI family transcriptional regulator|uniref:LacI family DNA-binding transcriptional regulator n=1 Tax=Pengzhenrongella sp. TaxID=2888820 RepID=UPI002F92EC27